jgi:hypothetical protein
MMNCAFPSSAQAFFASSDGKTNIFQSRVYVTKEGWNSKDSNSYFFENF